MRRMTVHRRPTLKTALWLMLTASILFAGNALVGGVEWRRPAYDRSSVEHSFAVAFTTEMLFWLVLPTALGMVSASTKQASHRCWAVAVAVFVLYFAAEHYADNIFGFSDAGLRVAIVTLSALFGPMLAAEVPARMADAAFDGPMIFVLIYGIWLGFYVMATDKIIGSLQEKPGPKSEASGVP